MADFDAHFANDSALFELGCYLYVRVDYWLFVNRRSRRYHFDLGVKKGVLSG